MDWTQFGIASGAFVVMIVGISKVITHMKERAQGFGPNSLKALGTVIFLPSLVVLGVIGNFNSEAIAALLGTIAGYVLSGSEK